MLTDKELESTKAVIGQIKSLAKETSTDERVVAEAMSIAQRNDPDSPLDKLMGTANTMFTEMIEDSKRYRAQKEASENEEEAQESNQENTPPDEAKEEAETGKKKK